MKKTEMQHPKLYLSAIKNNNHQIVAKYISNKFCTSGDLKEESAILNDIDPNTSIESILINLNKIELKKLEIFISRQEKVISIYKHKGKAEQYRMVSDSLKLLIELRVTFKNWFNKTECVV